MAGEKKGKAYEALVKLALDKLKSRGEFTGSVFWDEKPHGMTIVPDLTLGNDKDKPDFIILITHSGSAGDSHKKFWRNVGELSEAKLFLNTVPRCLCLIFDPVLKEELKKAQSASFDGQLIVGDLDYGTELQNWIDDNLNRFPKDKFEKVDFLHSEIKSDSVLKKVMKRFEKDLADLLKKRAPAELDELWKTERQRKHTLRVPRARNTFVRRGVSKVLVFEDLETAISLFSGKRVSAEQIPAYAYDLGLVSRAIGRAIPVDEDINAAVTLLGMTRTKNVLSKAPFDKLKPWLMTLRHVPHLRFMGDFFAMNLEKLCESRILYKWLKDLHSNPCALVESAHVPSDWPPAHVWLLEFAIELIKHSTGHAAGYGYAQLAREVADPHGPAESLDKESAQFLLSPWGHLSEWIHRVPARHLPDKVLRGVALVVSERLSRLSADQIKEGANDIISNIQKNIVETKLCAYRDFEPLQLLICETIKGVRLTKLRSCFGERAGLPGQATKTTLLKVKETLINWQSSHSTHTKDKKKELCGRAVALRYTWSESEQIFVSRPEVRKLALVVDGTWSRDDLNAMARAGWDEIYYPDEMDKLANAIV